MEARASTTWTAASSVTAVVPELAGLPVLREAAARRATVTFDYRGKRRRLDPYGLLLRTGFWYVVGHDHEHDEQRTYRVDRITGAVEALESGAFERPAGFDLRGGVPQRSQALGAEAARRGGGRARRCRSGGRASSASSGPARVLRRGADGAVEVEVPCANVPAFRSWVLGLLDHAEVVGPPDVRADVVAWLGALAGAPMTPTGRRTAEDRLRRPARDAAVADGAG